MPNYSKPYQHSNLVQQKVEVNPGASGTAALISLKNVQRINQSEKNQIYSMKSLKAIQRRIGNRDHDIGRHDTQKPSPLSGQSDWGSGAVSSKEVRVVEYVDRRP